MNAGIAATHTPTRIMGILNVTPDSFSDGGRYLDPERATARAREMLAQGAHLIDVGGESTRPGAARVTPEEEQRRILPVVRALASEGIEVSVDTVHASTARRAIEAGASLINDVSGGTADPMMLRVAAETGAGMLLMHWRGIPDPQHQRSTYLNVVEDVRSELAALADAALQAGIAPEKLILDPGLGFDKTGEQGWEILSALERFTSLGYPLLVGASRKRMIASELREGATAADLDLATAVVSAVSAQAGVWGVRVHDVSTTATALAVAAALNGARARRAAGASEPSALVDAGPVQRLAPGDDRIALTGLEVFAHHGVFDFEREQGQRFVIDAEITTDMRAAAAGDALARTVNYAELAEAILRAAQSDPVDLIETLAERLAQVALGFAGVSQARITVHKPDAPIDATFQDVSVTIVRRNGER